MSECARIITRVTWLSKEREEMKKKKRRERKRRKRGERHQLASQTGTRLILHFWHMKRRKELKMHRCTSRGNETT